MSNRRQFIQSFSVALTSPFLISSSELIGTGKTLKASLSPGAIGLKCTANELLDYAIKYKFSAISPPITELIQFKETDKKAYLEKMEKNKIIFDSGGLPIQFRTTDSKFKEGYDFLLKNIDSIVSLNINSFVTWIMPTHKTLPYMKNFEQHRTRLTKVATVLEDAGLKLGLEYVGPKTLMARDKYPFLHSALGLRELIGAIGKNNVGYLLDSYHTYCAEDQNEDLNFLKAEDIISVQLNDGVFGRTVATQMDLERELPGDTGIIDLKNFLNFIRNKGYKGAVSVEPFNKELNKMEVGAKLKRVRASLSKFDI